MEGSGSHGEQGGTHESLIGLGLGAGPALMGLALLWTGVPGYGAVAVATLLGVGLVTMGRVHQVARRHPETDL